MNCPSCNRLLYSRQHKTCGFCGADLPPEVLLSDDEVAAIKTEQAAIAIRRTKAKAREEEEKRKQAERAGGFNIPPMF